MLFSLGLDHRTAGLDVRERFHLADAAVPRVYAALAKSGVVEAVLTRTCNRLEVHCWWPADFVGDERPMDRGLAIARAWVGNDGPEADALLAHSRLRVSDDVVRHLLRVAAGLESQILGDIHILGQVRRSFRDAIEIGAVGPHLHRLFETALRVGKQVKRETHLMATRSGVGSEAARRALDHAARPSERHCVVVGSGKIGTQAVRSLATRGARRITVVNRTLHRAASLAAEVPGARAADLSALPELLAAADVVIVATDAPAPVLTARMLDRAMLARTRTRSEQDAADLGPWPDARLLTIDVSVPRNVEPAVARVAGVDLVDLDTLHPEAADVEKSRNAAVPEAEIRVAGGVEEYRQWLRLDAARRALRPLHEVLSEICHREVSYLAGDSPSSERTADRIVARVLAHPMTVLRAASARGESMDEAAGALRGLFA